MLVAGPFFGHWSIIDYLCWWLVLSLATGPSLMTYVGRWSFLWPLVHHWLPMLVAGLLVAACFLLVRWLPDTSLLIIGILFGFRWLVCWQMVLQIVHSSNGTNSDKPNAIVSVGKFCNKFLFFTLNKREYKWVASWSQMESVGAHEIYSVYSSAIFCRCSNE